VKIINLPCEICKKKTPHAEEPVPDLESATVWHCIYCGNERRPDEGGGSKVLA
jgi:hypothetical protein